MSEAERNDERERRLYKMNTATITMRKNINNYGADIINYENLES